MSYYRTSFFIDVYTNLLRSPVMREQRREGRQGHQEVDVQLRLMQAFLGRSRRPVHWKGGRTAWSAALASRNGDWGGPGGPARWRTAFLEEQNSSY